MLSHRLQGLGDRVWCTCTYVTCYMLHVHMLHVTHVTHVHMLHVTHVTQGNQRSHGSIKSFEKINNF